MSRLERLRAQLGEAGVGALALAPSDNLRHAAGFSPVADERAVVAALAAARPGATCGDVDAAARGVIADAGYGDRFLHRTGHGLGLSTHEAPWIMAGDAVVLRTGMVFSIEPGIYLEGDFGVRLEEIVVLGDDGPEIVSRLPRDLRVVGG
jgi:Xaa-Pro dipeptidase